MCRSESNEDIHFAGLAQDCNKSSALAMELRQSSAKPSIYRFTWASWRLMSSITRMFALQLVQVNNKENIKAQRTSNANSVFM